MSDTLTGLTNHLFRNLVTQNGMVNKNMNVRQKLLLYSELCLQTLPLRFLCRGYEKGYQGKPPGHSNRKGVCDLALRSSQQGQRQVRQAGLRLRQNLRAVERRMERRFM